MAASGILVDAVNAIKTALTALGLKPVTDPRNARPMSVFIELIVNGFWGHDNISLSFFQFCLKIRAFDNFIAPSLFISVDC